MVTSILMLLKENKTNFTFAIWILQSCNYTTKFVCSFSCPSALQFAINTYKAQHSQQCTRAGRRNAQRTAKCYYFSWESFFLHYLLVKLIESLKFSSKRHLRETTIAFHQLIDARGSRSYGKGVTSSSIQTFSLQIQSSSCIH